MATVAALRARLPVADHFRVSPGNVVVTRHVWSPWFPITQICSD